MTIINKKVHSLINTVDLPLSLGRMIALAGQKTTTSNGAEAGTQLGLADRSADLKLATIRGNGEAPNGLGGETGTGTAQTGGAMLNPAADAGTLKAATKTGLKMRIMGQDLGHEAPPSASKRWGLPAIYFPLYPAIERNQDQARKTRKQGRRR